MQLHKFLFTNFLSLIGLYDLLCFGFLSINNHPKFSCLFDIVFPTEKPFVILLLLGILINYLILILMVLFLIELFIHKKYKKQINYPYLPKWVEIMHIIIFYIGTISLCMPLYIFYQVSFR